MNYGEIKKCDIANGEGVRVSLFVSGCTHHCRGCFNPETWDFNYGRLFDDKAEEEIFSALSANYISGLSLLGGEPFEPENQRALLPFLRKVKAVFPTKNIWCYTGYLFEELLGGSKAHCECTKEMLMLIDILVDGEFHLEKKDISLAYRGSSNQRIINVRKSLEGGRIELYEPMSGRI